MDTKICTKCGEEKPATTEYFYRLKTVKSGLMARCRDCKKVENTHRYHTKYKHSAEWRQTQAKRVHSYYERTKEVSLARSRRWEKNNPERARELWRARASSVKGRKRVAAYTKKRRGTDPLFRLVITHRKRLEQALKAVGASKKIRFSLARGSSVAELASHLELRFLPGMSWDNYGKYLFGGPRRWNVDHIIPLLGRVDGELVFNFDSEEDCRVAWNLKNLVPLWGKDNVTKKNRVPHWNDIPKELQDICTPRIRDLLKKVKKTA
jgi:hypothetical protein